MGHVYDLAAELGCDLITMPNMAGMMYVEFGYVEGPVIENNFDYYVNLHELGHFDLDHTQGRPPLGHKRFYFDNGVLRSEAEAWGWALTSALEPPDADTCYKMWHMCMGSYYRGAQLAGGRPGQQLWNGNRHHVRFTYDEPDDYFWSIKRRMLEGS